MSYGTTKVDTIQSSTASTPPTFKDGNGTQIGTLCRAWVNFNGTGTVAIRGSFNVSSITDNGTGDYTINFTNAMPDANYAYTCGAGDNTNASLLTVSNGSVYSTTALRVHVTYVNTSGNYDTPYINVAIFR